MKEIIDQIGIVAFDKLVTLIRREIGNSELKRELAAYMAENPEVVVPTGPVFKRSGLESFPMYWSCARVYPDGARQVRVAALQQTVSALIDDIRTTIESAVRTGDISPTQARHFIDDVARRLRGRQAS